jgi:hypothetical protein
MIQSAVEEEEEEEEKCNLGTCHQQHSENVTKGSETKKRKKVEVICYCGCSPADVRMLLLLEYDPMGTSGKLSLILCSATAPASASILSTSSPLASKANEV